MRPKLALLAVASILLAALRQLEPEHGAVSSVAHSERSLYQFVQEKLEGVECQERNDLGKGPTCSHARYGSSLKIVPSL
jgi:hypothetical protein